MNEPQILQATHNATIPPGTATPRPDRWIKRRVRQLGGHLRWLAPNLIPAPSSDDEVYRRVRSEEINRDTRVLPEDELRIRAVWGVEVYGPRESDRLYGALAKLEWVWGSSNGDSVLVWAQQQRTYGRHGRTWCNVDHVVRRRDRARSVPHPNYAPLPDEVDYLSVRLHQIVPSVTCMVVCFVLNAEAATKYEDELNLDRPPVYRRARRWSIVEHGPIHLKQQAVERVRMDLSRMVEGWFGQNAPGFFCSLNQPQRFPTAELITTSSQDLFADRKGTPYFNWQKIIVNAAPHDVWTSDEIPGLRFSVEPAKWPLENRHHLVVGLQASCVPTDLLAVYGGAPSAYIVMAHKRIDGLLGYFAATAYLTEVAKEIKVMRDSMQPSKTKRHILLTIDRIQQFFDRNMGLPTATRELVEDARSAGAYGQACSAFTAPSWEDGHRLQLTESLRQQVQLLAKRLLDDESSTREQFEQLSTILSVRESIRAQRRMEWLATAAFIVGFCSMVAAFAAAPDNWLARIVSVLNALLSALK